MICAISPASVNYEESLSTLRYADRAKKIVNKAIVNESSQDKLIRSLREENEQLKKMLQDLPTSSSASSFNPNAQLEIEKAMQEADQKIKEIEQSWEEKLRQQKIKDEEEKRLQELQAKQKEVKDKKAPHLTNLNEDNQLTGKLYFSLLNAREKEFSIGRNSKNNLVLKGVGIQERHAVIKVDSLGNYTLEV